MLSSPKYASIILGLYRDWSHLLKNTWKHIYTSFKDLLRSLLKLQNVKSAFQIYDGNRGKMIRLDQALDQIHGVIKSHLANVILFALRDYKNFPGIGLSVNNFIFIA